MALHSDYTGAHPFTQVESTAATLEVVDLLVSLVVLYQTKDRLKNSTSPYFPLSDCASSDLLVLLQTVMATE